MNIPKVTFASPTDNELVRRLWNTASVYSGEALLAYRSDNDAHTLLQAMKYKGRPDVCQAMGRILATKLLAQDFLRDIDVLIPIPLSRQRQRQRGYNQSEHIALGIKRLTGIPIRSDILIRVVDNRSQTSLHATQRMQNVANIFRTRDTTPLKGKHILLLDDIVTTGSTLSSALQTLLQDIPHLTVSVACIGLTTQK